MLISDLVGPAQVLALTGQPLSLLDDPAAVLLAYVTFYDQRGGGVETSFKGDKQGLGIGKRSKKRFDAQQMVMLLGTLAHNVIVWARHWLASPTVAPLWDAAHGARCLSYQWLSADRCLRAGDSDCAQSGRSLGIGFSPSLAQAPALRSCGR